MFRLLQGHHQGRGTQGTIDTAYSVEDVYAVFIFF
jgi:hypothetical protein